MAVGFAVSGEFSPLMCQVLVFVFHRRIAIGKPLAFVGAGAVLLKSIPVDCEIQLTSRQIQIVVHGLILGFWYRGVPTPLENYSAMIGRIGV